MEIYQKNDRASFILLQDFWNLIERVLNKSTPRTEHHFTVYRDYIAFHLLYAYGLRPVELLALKPADICTDKHTLDFGCIFSRYNGKTRIIYPLFSNSIDEVTSFFDCYHAYYFNMDRYIFSTSTGKNISINYLNNRLNYYNSLLHTKNIIDKLHKFRLLYINDLLAFGDIPKSFINNQIGNCILDNQVYKFNY